MTLILTEIFKPKIFSSSFHQIRINIPGVFYQYKFPETQAEVLVTFGNPRISGRAVCAATSSFAPIILRNNPVSRKNKNFQVNSVF